MARIEERLSDRLAELIEESDEPMAEMQMASAKLLENDLANYLPNAKTSPRSFAAAVIEDNPQMREHLAGHRVYLNDLDLSAIETPEQLVNLLLPGSSE